MRRHWRTPRQSPPNEISRRRESAAGLSLWIVQHGFDAIHVRDARLLGKPDPEIARFAIADDRTIVTRDGDFERFENDDRAPRVLLIKVGNISTPRLLAWIEPRWNAAMDAFSRGDHTVKLG